MKMNNTIRTIPCLLLLLLSCSLLYSQRPSTVLELSDPYKYGWHEESNRLTFRDSLTVSTSLLNEYNNLKQSSWTNALKTAVAPGWGHFSIGRNTKGQIFLVSQLAILGTSLYYYERSMIHYRKYRDATNIDDINEHYDNAVEPYRRSNLFLGLFFVVWGYSIYDVMSETSSYNGELWNQIVEEEMSKKKGLQITPTGISWRF